MALRIQMLMPTYIPLWARSLDSLFPWDWVSFLDYGPRLKQRDSNPISRPAL